MKGYSNSLVQVLKSTCWFISNDDNVFDEHTSLNIWLDFLGLLNAKAVLVEEQQWYFLTHNWVDKGFHTLFKFISLKVNVDAQMEFELSYYYFTVHHFQHNATGIPHLRYLFVSWSVIFANQIRILFDIFQRKFSNSLCYK